VSGVLKLDVAPEFVAGLAKLKKPILGIEELIWNALDADANNVEVVLKRNTMDGLDRIIITDDGHGMKPTEKEIAFGRLGGSPKRLQGRSPDGRVLHGKEGKGRFRAFGLGARAEWRSRYRDEKKEILEWRISGDATNLCNFPHEEPKPSGVSNTGTTVTITNVDMSLAALSSPEQDFGALVADVFRRLGPHAVRALVVPLVGGLDGAVLGDGAPALRALEGLVVVVGQRVAHLHLDLAGAVAGPRLDPQRVPSVMRTPEGCRLCDLFLVASSSPSRAQAVRRCGPMSGCSPKMLMGAVLHRRASRARSRASSASRPTRHSGRWTIPPVRCRGRREGHPSRRR
jgi:hypothetical protein